VTLAQRLLLAIAAVTIATAVTAGFFFRKAWRETEELRFAADYRDVVQRLGPQLAEAALDVENLVEFLCDEDSTVDGALVALRAGTLDDRRLQLRLLVPKLKKAHGLDELVLLTDAGEVLGAHDAGLVGQRDRALVERVKRGGKVTVRQTPPLAFEVACQHPKPERGERNWVGLYAARHLDEELVRVGKSAGVALSRNEPPSAPTEMAERVTMEELPGVTVWASRSRVPVLEALGTLDRTLYFIGGAALAGAIVVALLASRGLARPIVEMSRQAREVVHGEPKPVAGGGGRELEEFAEVFNRAIADLTQLRKRLAAAERIAARREIARRVAHEIKNPLAPIRAAVETLRRLRARADPAFEEYFDEATRTVLDEVARISHIVGEFTRFARLPPPNPAPMDLVEAARSVVGLHATEGVKLRLDSDPRLPIVADRDQMVQILTNLVQNALDAVRQEPSPEVTVEVRRNGDHARLAVRDNGPGFTPEVREHLFEPYLTTKANGTGLGLAIVQRIVVEHGGDITLAEEPGPGAALVVDLPLAGPPATPEKEPPPSSTSH
jgi:two-component system, NtrC family, nitrogen regulation sensor histidine kinase NtrY